MPRPATIAPLGPAARRAPPPPPPRHPRLAWWIGCVLLLGVFFAFSYLNDHLSPRAGDDYAAGALLAIGMVTAYLASAYCGARSFRARWAQSLWAIAQTLGPIAVMIAYDAIVHHRHP